MSSDSRRWLCVLVGWLGASAFAPGCADRATVGYNQCVEREAAGDLSAALSACTFAAETSPGSDFGKLANERARKIQAVLDARRFGGRSPVSASAESDAGGDASGPNEPIDAAQAP